MEQSNPRQFRRYSNRKIYDVADSKYVTLEDIVSLVREGHDVMVVQHDTKKDITQRTLVEAINKVASKGAMHSYGTLTSLIKTLELSGNLTVEGSDETTTTGSQE